MQLQTRRNMQEEDAGVLSAEQHWDELIRKMDRVQYVGNILRTKRYVIYVEIVILCSSQNTWIKKDNMCLQPYGFILEYRHLYSESIGVRV